ncbi:MAG: ASPIC/UnbV domain-containing protein [Verrucomicrobiae bacterium]|nr:ASPIC/UnbV domain-containing protein [Verrucomicrobiae bacterium]
MSQAPVLESEYEGAAKAYADATVELNRRVDQGTSWSGNERNNLFLNLGNSAESKSIPNFVDASALTGFDFPDDSRGLASIDWDFDGDLDFITTNRTAPRVRILENHAGARTGSFVLLKLVGSGGVNRDAIGSRVDLTLETEDGGEAVLVRSLHGGQGFISQSSAWLHFGIPKGAKIVRAEVRWPGGQREEFAGCEPGRHFLMNCGSGQAQPWDAPVVRIPKVDPAPVTPEEATVTAILERRVPLPAIPYIALNGEGESREIDSKLERPLVLNLWATWCVPCLAELRGMAEQAELFQSAGVDVLALCVDVAAGGDAGELEKARKILADAGFPFDAGIAAEKTIELLHIVHNTVFVRPEKLPVPTTLLIDTSGRIASIYRGAIEPADLLPAIAALQGSADDWTKFATPFDGRWAHGPDTIYYSGIAKELLDRGWNAEAERFVVEHRESLEADGQKYAELLMLMGTQLLERNAQARGLEMLEIAVEVGPDLPAARNNLAVALLQAGRSDDAVPHLVAAIALDPHFAEPAVNLARVRLAQGKSSEALRLADAVLADSYQGGAIRVKAQVHLARNEPAEVLTAFQTIVENEPNEPTAWLNLGKLQLQLGNAGLAMHSFERAQQLDPGNSEVKEWMERIVQGNRLPGGQ